ncbi:MAG TPA: hypothetical protein VFD57_03235 [Clostridia bacterium]|nr:hypothetical protein [Clostridia bacterium]
MCILWIANSIVHADDGGWTESGRNLLGWLGNPGTKIIGALGFGGATGIGLGWLGDTALGGLGNAINLGEAMTVASVLAGTGSPESLGNAALGAALGPVGDVVGSAWGTASDVLGGGGSEGSEGGGSSAGSGDFGGGSEGSTDGGRFPDSKRNKGNKREGKSK